MIDLLLSLLGVSIWFNLTSMCKRKSLERKVNRLTEEIVRQDKIIAESSNTREWKQWKHETTGNPLVVDNCSTCIRLIWKHKGKHTQCKYCKPGGQ